MVKSTFLNWSRSLQVFGAFWYLFSIERKVKCWREDCNNRGVGYCSLYCDDTFSRGSSTLFPHYDSCSTKAGNSTLFGFGIYTDAIESGVVGSADFIHKISYCFWWGLQNLRSVSINVLLICQYYFTKQSNLQNFRSSTFIKHISQYRNRDQLQLLKFYNCF